KRAEEALGDAQERLRQERDFSKQILETANVLICVVDREGRIVRFNGTCAALAGCSEDEVRGAGFWDLFPGRDADVAHDGHQPAGRSQETHPPPRSASEARHDPSLALFETARECGA